MDQVELTGAFRAGELSTNDYISRIEVLFEEREPSVLAFILENNRFDRLFKEAEELALRYPDPQNRPLLFGMLVGIKDIFHVDGFATQAGSSLPPNELQGSEAETASRLKSAGALILGKTVTTEFAYFTPGPTRNPHNPGHTPGGSSSGSAAAVGAGLCPLALGTQTIGSIIRPAAFCGTIGVKPTYDRISRKGVIPLSPALDHVGYFTLDIKTAKIAASALYLDWSDSVSSGKKPTLGIPTGPYLASASDYGLSCFESFCKSLSDAGFEFLHIPVMDDFIEIRNRHDVIMSAEAARVHEDWFEQYEEFYSPKFVELVKRGRRVSGSQLQNAIETRDEFRAKLTRTMNEKEIDVWICPPTVGPAPKGLESTGDPIMNLPWTQVGFPAINIPTGRNDAGLPIGLQVIGRWNADEDLLAWAEGLEKVVGGL